MQYCIVSEITKSTVEVKPFFLSTALIGCAFGSPSKVIPIVKPIICFLYVNFAIVYYNATVLISYVDFYPILWKQVESGWL